MKNLILTVIGMLVITGSLAEANSLKCRVIKSYIPGTNLLGSSPISFPASFNLKYYESVDGVDVYLYETKTYIIKYGVVSSSHALKLYQLDLPRREIQLTEQGNGKFVGQLDEGTRTPYGVHFTRHEYLCDKSEK